MNNTSLSQSLDHMLIGASMPILEVKALVRRYAPTSYTVLIDGETGSGKGVVARLLHDLSSCRMASFIPVNYN